MSKILILGGTGFIGCNVGIEAIKRGYKVVAFDNLSRQWTEENLVYMRKNYPNDFEFIWGDVRNKEDFLKIPTVDAVINFAANPSVMKSIEYPEYDFNTNTVGVLNSLMFAKKFSIPYLYASTNKTFSDITNVLPIIEKEKRYEWSLIHEDKKIEISTGLDMRINDKYYQPVAINDYFSIDGYGKYGHSIYGIDKLAGELLVQEWGLEYKIPTVIFKMSCIFGLLQKGVEEQAWVDFFLRKIMLEDGKINIFGSGKQVRDVLDGRDTARAYLDALENIDKVNHEIFTLGGGPENTYSLLEAIEVIEKLTGKKANLTFHPKRPHDQDIYISSIKKIKEKLGWEPKIKFEDALKDMIKQYEN